MKYIEKGEPPKEFEDYKKTPEASFSDLGKEKNCSIKRILKESLLAEQGYICCYCGNRIGRGNSSIEHFMPKDENLYPELQLEYSNLLASCRIGDSKRSKKELFEGKKFPLNCDVKKDNNIISVSPLDPNCESLFTYDEEGNIYGLTKAARYAIEILGLNNAYLVHERKAAIDAYSVIEDASVLEEDLEYLSKKDEEGKFKPFCFAVIYYIKNYMLAVEAA